MSMSVLPVAQARDELTKLVDSAVRTHERFHITRNGTPAAVLMSEDDYESLRETIEILSDPEARAEVRRGTADLEAGRTITGAEMERLMAARTEGHPIPDHEVDVIAGLHAAGVPDHVCLAALDAIIARHAGAAQ
jgi:antitoxin YefM